MWRFLSLVPVVDVTGKGLSNVILNSLENSGFNCAYLFWCKVMLMTGLVLRVVNFTELEHISVKSLILI